MEALSYQMTWLREWIANWSSDELAGLHALISDNPSAPADRDALTRQIEAGLHWSYYSETGAAVKDGADRLLGKILKRRTAASREQFTPPITYQHVLEKVARINGVWRSAATEELTEQYVAERVFIEALAKMKPDERHKAFVTQMSVEAPGISSNAGRRVVGSAAGVFGALALAQASGFGVYLLATTSLGFLTHAVGIALPFAVYTGMTSTIAFLIGPLGWLGAAGTFAALWGKGKRDLRLTRAVLYLVVGREAHKSW